MWFTYHTIGCRAPWINRGAIDGARVWAFSETSTKSARTYNQVPDYAHTPFITKLLKWVKIIYSITIRSSSRYGGFIRHERYYWFHRFSISIASFFASGPMFSIKPFVETMSLTSITDFLNCSPCMKFFLFSMKLNKILRIVAASSFRFGLVARSFLTASNASSNSLGLSKQLHTSYGRSRSS